LLLCCCWSVPAAQQPILSAAAAPAPVNSVPRQPQPRPLLAPSPSVSVSGGTPQLGTNFTITATFSKPRFGYRYGPFIDLYIPHTGPDGVFPGSPPSTSNDGISPPLPASSYTASYLGSSLTVYTLDFPNAGGGTGCVNSPAGVGLQAAISCRFAVKLETSWWSSSFLLVRTHPASLPPSSASRPTSALWRTWGRRSISVRAAVSNSVPRPPWIGAAPFRSIPPFSRMAVRPIPGQPVQTSHPR